MVQGRIDASGSTLKTDSKTGVKKFYINHIPAAWISPDNSRKSTVMLYLHGGGFIAGSIKSHRDLATRIARASRVSAVIIEYRLAPEHPFPAGLDDSLTAYEWLLSHGFASDKICLAGDSAGGGLALSLLLKIKEKKLPMPCAAALISPWTDHTCNNPSHRKNQKKDPMINQYMLFHASRLYTGGKNLDHYLVSPANADFKGLCPLLVQAGSLEVLMDDAVHLAEKAKNAGVKVTLEIWPDMFHVWHFFSRFLVQGREAVSEIGKFIQSHTN
ncbi:MAG: alpha/beta hydrolase [Thermodesulfobacteriota bacterium]|nr:alpha/beta hydrolase [Thermodesulfobacteriota bacterium]